MHAKLRDAGVEAELHVSEGMPHGGFSGAPEDDHLRRQVRRFLDRHRHDESEPSAPDGAVQQGAVR